MNKAKIIVAAAIFLLLTSLKIFFPSISQSLKTDVKKLVNYNDDYSKAAEHVSSFFEKEDFTVTETPQYEKKNVSLQVKTRLIPVASNPPALENSDEKDSGELLPEVSDYPEEIIEAFLESQKPYADISLPANATYSYVSIPFHYVTPIIGYNSSGFGYRMHPILNKVKFHYGTDFAAFSGEPIYAFADGVVNSAAYSESYGNYVVISHADGFESLYAHCSKLLVSSGDTVSAGDNIALVGDTGLATGPHLHFELTDNDVYLNPEYYINSK